MVPVCPAQIVSLIALMTGYGLTTTVKVIGLAQSPAFGVNVYVVVLKKLGAGDHEPRTAFSELVGRVNELPAQIGAIGLKVGIVLP